MQSLIELRKKFVLYAKHGGAWEYIKNQLTTGYNVKPELVDMIINHIRLNNLGYENGIRAEVLFKALELCISQNNYESYDFLAILDVKTEDRVDTWLSIISACSIKSL